MQIFCTKFLKMNRRLIVISVIILAILGGSFYFFANSTKHSSHIGKGKQGETIEFMPFPVIISNDTGKKDNILYEALINKSEKIITISNGSLDLSGVLSKQNLVYNNLFVNFKYNPQDEKVDFQGYTANNGKEIQINGSYGFNTQKQIEFDINVKSDLFTSKINAIFSPSSQNVDDGVYTGSFSVESNDFWNSVNIFSTAQNIFDIEFKKDYSANIVGDFEIKNKFLSVKDVKFSSDAIDFALSYEQASAEEETDNMTLDISKLNFADIVISNNGESLRKVRNVLAYMFGDQDIFGPVSGVITAPEIKFDDSTEINDFALTYSCDVKNKVKIDNVSFRMGDDNVIKSTGVLASNNYRPSYQGTVKYEIKSPIKLNKIAKIFDGYKDEISGVIEADIILTPVMINLKNYKISGGKVASEGNVRFSYYGNNFKSVYSDIKISNLGSAEKSEDLANVIDHFSSYYDQDKNETLARSLMNFKKFHSIYDMNITLENSDIFGQSFDNAQARIVLRTNNFNIHDIKVNSNSSDLRGQFGVNVEGAKPYLTWKMQGDYLNGEKILNFLNIKSIEANESSETNVIASSGNGTNYNLPNKDIKAINLQGFDGYINFDFKKVAFQNTELGDFFFDAVIKDELMKVRKLNMTIYDGYLQSLGNVTFNPLAFNMAYSYSGGNIAMIAEKLFDSKRFSGGLNMTGNIYGKGYDTHELIKNLGGSFSFKTNKLLVNKFNIKSLLATYGTNVSDDFNAKVSKGSTMFNSFVGKASFDNGYLKMKNAVFATKHSDGKLSSEVNLINGDQNSMVSFAFIDKKGKVDGFNISFTGPLAEPKISLGAAAKQ